MEAQASRLDRLIDQLGPGESSRLGGDASCWTTVERSAAGRSVRFVRHRPAGFEVFQAVATGPAE